MMLAGSLLAPRAVLPTSSAFKGQRVALRPQRLARVQRADVRVRAEGYIREYPNPEFIAEVRDSFPEKMIATPDEARVLYADGWTYLDVRPTLECDEVGKFKGAVNIPLVNSIKKYDPVENKKTYVKEDNPDFIPMIQRKFPNPEEAKLIVGCSDGTAYSLDALEMLDEAGYVNLVGLKGGYYAWTRVFDNNLRRRRGDGYTEAYDHGAESCGIHATGAGFQMMDKADVWVPPKF